MAQVANVLPFFFRRIDALGHYLITNQAGAFAFLETEEQLSGLIDTKFSQLSPEKLNELTSTNFVTEADDYAERVSLLGSRYASLVAASVVLPTLFIIVPTLRCDHDCGYCQVSRVSVDREGFDLDHEKIEPILNIIDVSTDSSPKIEFQGGEPLLAFPFIKKFVEVAEKRLAEKSPSFVICSALGELPDEIVDWSRHHDVVFSVSLDGPELLHNKNRPSTHFQPHQQVLKNVHTIRTIAGFEKVNCLATVTRRGLPQAKQIIDTYYGLGLEGVFLRPLSPFGFVSQNSEGIEYSAEEFFKFFKNALDRVIDLNSGRLFVEETTLVHLKKIFRPGDSTYVDLKSPAGHVLGALLFNYDGKIFGSDEARMLWETTKAPELVMGSVGDDPSLIFRSSSTESMLADTFTGAMPGCDECAYQMYCGADPLHHLATQGDHIGDKSLSFFCQLERKIFDHIFTLYESSPKARVVFDQWLTS